MKDNFSKDSHNYATYRPHYPSELYEYLFPLLDEYTKAWDCATGNGQVANVLAQKFTQVEATDISKNQLAQAPAIKNITYSIQQAEKTTFESNQFDLISVAQAIHWFNFDEFYAEAKRTLKPNGLIAIIGYALLKISPKIDEIISEFYQTIIGEYWDKERIYIEENYQTIPFPFSEITTPNFEIIYHWKAENLLNYLNTWSAVKHYEEKHQKNPMFFIEEDLKSAWGNEKRTVKFPILLRLGKQKIFK